jgi:hypothetical protein
LLDESTEASLRLRVVVFSRGDLHTSLVDHLFARARECFDVSARGRHTRQHADRPQTSVA